VERVGDAGSRWGSVDEASAESGGLFSQHLHLIVIDRPEIREAQHVEGYGRSSVGGTWLGTGAGARDTTLTSRGEERKEEGACDIPRGADRPLSKVKYVTPSCVATQSRSGIGRVGEWGRVVVKNHQLEGRS
jgi:hypothetical protein